MPKLVANEPPPPDYYADNLRQLLSHVQWQYADLLNAEEQQFIERYLALSCSAQRLYARLLGRKGPWIRVDRLDYSEVADLADALQELCGAGLVTLSGQAPAEALLGLLTQTERIALFPAVDDVGRGHTKQQQIRLCLSRYPDDLIARRIAAQIPWVCVAQYRIFHRCQLLFFGDSRQDLSTFVLQDLGLLNYEPYALCPKTRQFADRAALDRYLRLLALNSLSHRLDELEGLSECLFAQLSATQGGARLNRLERRLCDKSLNRLGRWFERRGEAHSALACYALSERHPARERRARLLKAAGDMLGVECLLDEIRAQPWSAQEQDFAERFGQRRRCSIPTTRMSLNGGRVERIEHYAMHQIARPGDQVWHLENTFPLALAGLAYWPVVFAEVPGAFVNPFQAAPVDLYWDDFLAPRGAAIMERERALDEDFAGVLRETYACKQTVTNRLVNWAGFTPEVLEAALIGIPVVQARALARYVLENLARARVGFPDLLVVRAAGDYEFIEVKGPTDQLQPAQRIWFQALERLQMPARVLKFAA